MNKKLITKTTSKKLMIGGAVGYVAGIILSFVILLPLYGRVNDCLDANNCSTDFTWEQIGAKLVSVMMYLSAAAFTAGVLMFIALIVKSKLLTPTSANPKRTEHLIIKTIALIAAFFVGGSVVSIVVVNVVPALFPSKDINQQARIFAYALIILYPLAGGSAVYFTNRYLKKKLS